MNREDIIRMAREAGLVDNDFEPSEWCVHEYMAFAALVASAEREACIKALEDLDAWNMDDPASTATKVIRARGQA